VFSEELLLPLLLTWALVTRGSMRRSAQQALLVNRPRSLFVVVGEVQVLGLGFSV